MAWIKHLILSLPFLIAAVLTILMASADHFHLYREHIAGCGFLFATPLGLVDRSLRQYSPLSTISLAIPPWEERDASLARGNL